MRRTRAIRVGDVNVLVVVQGQAHWVSPIQWAILQRIATLQEPRVAHVLPSDALPIERALQSLIDRGWVYLRDTATRPLAGPRVHLTKEGEVAISTGRDWIRSIAVGHSAGSALPPGFEGFGAEVFGMEDAAPLSRTHFNQHEPLARLRKGDTLRVGQATFVVHRVIGTYQTDVYKQGVKRPYLLHQIDRDRVAVRVLRGTMDSTLAEPPVFIVDVSKVKVVKRAEPL